MLPPTLKFNSLLQLQEALDKEYHPDLLEQLKENPRETLRLITELPDETAYEKRDALTVQEMKAAISTDPALADLVRYNPEAFFRKLVRDDTAPQYKIYRLLVGTLCTALVLIIVGALAGWFIKNSKTPPDSLIAMASVIIGILVGMFIHVPGKGVNTKN